MKEYSFASEDPEICTQLTKYVKKHRLDISRGDTLILDCVSGYRNDGVYLWDGSKVIDLYTDVDDYGSVPPDMKIFDEDDDYRLPTHWEGIIDHNHIVWFDVEPYKDELAENITYNKNGGKKFIFYTWCILPDGKRLFLEFNTANCSYSTVYIDEATQRFPSWAINNLIKGTYELLENSTETPFHYDGDNTSLLRQLKSWNKKNDFVIFMDLSSHVSE